MLVFEPKEKDVMDRPPRNPSEPILTFPLIMRTGLVTLIMLAGAFSLFLWEQRGHGASVQQARTTVVNVVVLVEMFYLLSCRSLLHSPWSVGLFVNKWVWFGILAMATAQLLFTYAPTMNQLFHSAPIAAESWLRILAVGVVAFGVIELEKWIRLLVSQRCARSGKK
jgi:magnesium-transporting ATPase (P-type)